LRIAVERSFLVDVANGKGQRDRPKPRFSTPSKARSGLQARRSEHRNIKSKKDNFESLLYLAVNRFQAIFSG
jgi:hypothetical protein